VSFLPMSFLPMSLVPMSLVPMSLVTMRPIFRLHLAGDMAANQAKLEQVLRRPEWRALGQMFGDYIEFHVAEDQQRCWSPHLAVHLEPLDQHDRVQYRHTDGAQLAQLAHQTNPANRANPANGGQLEAGRANGEGHGNGAAQDPSLATGHTLLLGRFAPRQNVWMLVWIVYLAMACVVFFAVLGAVVQQWLNQWPWAWAIAGAAVLIIVGLHLISQIGQRWSTDQMVELRSRLDNLLRESGVQTRAS
jgi:hypothetical protein